MGQIIKEYGPKAHTTKAGTPSMGGVCFLALSATAGAILVASNMITTRDFLSLWGFPVLAGLIGFWDDWKKFTSKSSEGLTSIQKLLAQVLVTLPWAVFYASRGIDLIPNVTLSYSWTLFWLFFLGVGVMNAVNVTDGLDGLATGMFCISLIATVLLTRQKVILFSVIILVACLVAFLWDNSHPARLFMGDVGAHFLGAFLINLCVQYGSFGMVVPLSFFFGIELLSVLIQIVAIRVFKRKVFYMSPLHHHFEILGWSEVKIVVRFWILHLVGIAGSIAIMRLVFMR